MENNQLAMENTKNQPGVVYDSSLEYTLKKMKKNNGFFKTHEDQERGVLWNEKLKMIDGTRVEIEDKEFDFHDDIQNVFQDTKKSVKELNNEDKVILSDLLETVGYFNQGPTRGHPSGRDKYIRDKLRDEVYRN